MLFISFWVVVTIVFVLIEQTLLFIFIWLVAIVQVRVYLLI